MEMTQGCPAEGDHIILPQDTADLDATPGAGVQDESRPKGGFVPYSDEVVAVQTKYIRILEERLKAMEHGTIEYVGSKT
jgi:hypothetical protein